MDGLLHINGHDEPDELDALADASACVMILMHFSAWSDSRFGSMIIGSRLLGALSIGLDLISCVADVAKLLQGSQDLLLSLDKTFRLELSYVTHNLAFKCGYVFLAGSPLGTLGASTLLCFAVWLHHVSRLRHWNLRAQTWSICSRKNSNLLPKEFEIRPWKVGLRSGL